VKLLETVVPARLGTPFRWLLASSWTSNAGDGIALAAGPLLVASQTSNATYVALAALLQRLPWLLFGLYAGVLADRLDRRLVVMTADVLRAVVLAVLVVSIVTDRVSIAVVLAVMFLLGTAETFADTTTSALTPMVVGKRDLGIANARVMGGFIVANQLAGPPVGAALFAPVRRGPSWPRLCWSRSGWSWSRGWCCHATVSTGKPPLRACSTTFARAGSGCGTTRRCEPWR